MQPQVPMPVAAPVTYANHQYGGVGQSQRMIFSGKGMQICAILMVVFGVASIVFGITRIIIPAYDIKYVGCGVWGGILFLIPGILGAIACTRRKEDRCLIVACTVMSIIASAASVTMLAFASAAIPTDRSRSKHSAVALESLEIMISICTLVVSILLSVICGRATCNCTSPNDPVRVVYVPQHVGPPSGQPVTFLQPTVQQPGAQVTVINPNMAATNAGGGPAVLYRY